MATILFIDDESQTLELFNELYFRENQVFTAINSSAAYEILHQEQINIVFVDILLAQNENGYELATLISADFPQINIYLMTGLDKNSIAQKNKAQFKVFNKSELVFNADDTSFLNSFTSIPNNSNE